MIPWWASRRAWVALAVLAALMFAAPLLILVGTATPADAAACSPGQVRTTRAGVTAEQARNARVIVAAGVAMHVPRRGLIIAIATALQESTLHNYRGGDRDSVGLFQQRANWGTYAQRHNPEWAARAFYRALLRVRGWQRMAVTVAAQTVQQSGLPDAYAQWQPLATRLVGGSDAAPCEPVSVSGVVPGDARTQAAAILRAWGTRIVGKRGAKADLEATATGAGMVRCGHHVALDADLLRLVQLAMLRWKLTVWNFVTDHACDAFYHPPGMATDLGAVQEISSGRATNFYPGQSDPALVAKFIDYVAAVGPNHLAMGQSECADHSAGDAAYQRVSFPDGCTHQHLNVHQNDPQWGPYRKETWPK